MYSLLSTGPRDKQRRVLCGCKLFVEDIRGVSIGSTSPSPICRSELCVGFAAFVLTIRLFRARIFRVLCAQTRSIELACRVTKYTETLSYKLCLHSRQSLIRWHTGDDHRRSSLSPVAKDGKTIVHRVCQKTEFNDEKPAQGRLHRGLVQHSEYCSFIYLNTHNHAIENIFNFIFRTNNLHNRE